MQQRKNRELVKRYIFFFVGICLNAFGVALFTRSLLGTGPTSCIPYVVSMTVPLTFGECTFLFNFLLFFIQILLLRKNFPKAQFLQLPVTMFFSILLDRAMAITDFVNPNVYFLSLFYNILGCGFRALGVSFQVVADVVMLSTEAFVKAISDVTKKEFSKCKLIFDIIMAVIAVVISLCLIGRLEGVREGTLLIVLLVGPISHFFTDKLKFTNYVFENESEIFIEPKLKISNSKRLLITITSEAGSGGRVIAQILGKKIGIPVHDKDLVEKIAIEGGFSKNFVSIHNEILYRSAIEAFINENYGGTDYKNKKYTDLFDAQCRTIHKLAANESCIIVGHCSNFILLQNEEVLNILITADKEHRISYISEKYNISRQKAEKKIKNQDKDTFEFYRHFTGQNWKDSSNYQLTIDSTLFGYEGTAEIIEEIAKKNYLETPRMKLKDLITKYELE